jgi:hypothetical protein
MRGGRVGGVGRLVAAIVLALACLAPAARARTAVEVALVLAVDSSASVNYQEFSLQMQGIANAFRDPAVIATIQASGPNGIAVCLLQWSGAVDMAVVAGWTQVRNADEAERFAVYVETAGRVPSPAGTAIGLALRAARWTLAEAPFDAVRRIIDVSGDGRANFGVLPDSERDAAVADGITINGLAILNEEPELDAYYEAHVIGGPGSFAMVAKDYQDFARAIRLKLLRELGGAVAAR